MNAGRRRHSDAKPSATTVLIDAGNTRLKWAVVRHGSVGGRLDAVMRGGMALDALRSVAALQAVMRRADARSRVLVCNVAGAAVTDALTAASRKTGLMPPVFLRSQARAGGVVNAYRQPWRLGVDRWMALLGARQHFPGRAVCIVAVGTALTVDLMQGNGRHLGGAIIPAPPLMISALLEGTAGIRRRAGSGDPIAWLKAASSGKSVGQMYADSTRAGLVAGARHACAAYIDRAFAQAGRVTSRPLLVVRGGGAQGLMPLLESPAVFDDDLVLSGVGQANSV